MCNAAVSILHEEEKSGLGWTDCVSAVERVSAVGCGMDAAGRRRLGPVLDQRRALTACAVPLDDHVEEVPGEREREAAPTQAMALEREDAHDGDCAIRLRLRPRIRTHLIGDQVRSGCARAGMRVRDHRLGERDEMRQRRVVDLERAQPSEGRKGLGERRQVEAAVLRPVDWRDALSPGSRRGDEAGCLGRRG